jgi:hypothetical protein
VKSASPVYPDILQVLTDCRIAGINLGMSLPRYCGDKHVVINLLALGIKHRKHLNML